MHNAEDLLQKRELYYKTRQEMEIEQSHPKK